MELIAREDADIVKGKFSWVIVRGWAKRRMTFQSETMLGSKGFIKNIQIRTMHIVYEPIIQVSRTITHVWFFLLCQIKVFLWAKQSP